MKKSTNKKLLKSILGESRNSNMKDSKIKTKSKPDNPTKTINYDFTLLNEIFKGVENRKFISTELKRIAEEYSIPAIAQMPLDARISTLADNGRIEDYETEALGDILTQIENAQAKSVE
jgi:hypothetical protein